MASITTWTRLEPHSRAADMEAGLELRVHDPLWMLARQWQFGEFQGEDTGSPIWIGLTGTETPISLYLPGALAGHEKADVQDYSPDTPLEFVVERERTPADKVMLANRRLAADAGQYFLRLLGTALANKYRKTLLANFKLVPPSAAGPEPRDVETRGFLDLMVERALDGASLLAIMQENKNENSAALALGFESDDVQEVVPVLKTWLDWCEKTIGPTAKDSAVRPSWDPERMEYSCAVAAPGASANSQIVLAAKEYHGGHLDWYAFDTIAGATLKNTINAAPKSLAVSTLPTPLNFAGMPSNRLWEFEDAQVRFGAITAAPTDLARMLLVEFLVAYGNDFFRIPINLSTGSIIQLSQVTVKNTFGDVTTALPFSEKEWRMFALTTDGSSGSAPSLFLPPVLGQHLQSPPIEELHLLRDEMANMGWAVEHIVESEAGKPVQRHEAEQARRELAEKDKLPVTRGALVYYLDTLGANFPKYWLPLQPVQDATGKSPIRLELGEIVNRKGQLLTEPASGSILRLYDEEVPRAGAHVTRSNQYSRWYGGGTFVWVGREKTVGRGEGSSGLRNDVVQLESS